MNMQRRCYLFGPITVHFADQNLDRARKAGHCLTFGQTGTDVKIEPGDTWEAVSARLPAGWQPDFIALWLAYTSIPDCLWRAPVPLVGLAADWNLLFHGYRQLRSCELVLTDTAGVEVFRREGIGHVRAANLFGLERAFLESSKFKVESSKLEEGNADCRFPESENRDI